jgi:Reverse transcriptase (RNA-dependent DNA polymerase)
MMLKNKRNSHDLNQSPFYCLKSKRKLVEILQISLCNLETVINHENLYFERDIKGRHIEEPKKNLKLIHKRIEDLLKRIRLPDYIHSPGKGSSYISNAKIHTNAKLIGTIDIRKYFLSTPKRHIYHFFYSIMKCSSDVAAILAKISTFKDHLPTGSPLSPILSYFSHMHMWQSIHEIGVNANCKISIYSDDITISGDQISGKTIHEIKEKLRECGLSSNRKKEKLYKCKKPCKVTGIIITSSGELKSPNRQHLKYHQTRQLLRSEINYEKRSKLLQISAGLASQIQQVKAGNS